MAARRHMTISVALRSSAATIVLLTAGASLAVADDTAIPEFVQAQSRYGHGHVEGRVQDTAKGPQVQLPGGRWIYCRRSCSETLRVETIDFFESNAAGSGQLTNECGILGCLELGFTH